MFNFVFSLLAAVTFGGTAMAADAPPLATLLNNPSDDEIAAYESIKTQPIEARKFIATRTFFRQIRANPQKPQYPPKDVCMDYALDLDEQIQLYKYIIGPTVANAST